VPRARFAPSPTGYLHVGSAQSALFNWLFARGSGGMLLLRIEDTDVERNRPELAGNIVDMLRWLGIDWDGEPVHQSKRAEVYAEAVQRLIEHRRAYWCDCTREQIDARSVARGGPPGYDGHCRDRKLGPGPGRALRFRTPDSGVTAWHDIVRGHVSFDNAHVEDFVIMRSTGAPLFILANTVDDADMGITHVIRGEDHVNNAPKYLLLWQALAQGPPPTFAHLPLLVSEARKKLSKRRDDVSVAEYKERGFLPEAMRNYLALLGWGPRDGVEIRPIEEIMSLFRLEDVSSSPAFFDVTKLLHINGEYIRALPEDEFVDRAAEFLPPGDAPLETLRALAHVVQERVRTLAEVPEVLEFLWRDEPELDADAWFRATRDNRSASMLSAVLDRLNESGWNVADIEAAVRDAGAAAGFVNAEGNVQLAKAQAPVRVALTGQRVGLPLWESIVALGRERTRKRLNTAFERLAAERGAARGLPPGGG
jgi:glutamyl-tRNA synthetase